MQVNSSGTSAYQAVQQDVKPKTEQSTATAPASTAVADGSAVPVQQDTVTLSPESLALSGGEVKTMGNTLPPWPTKEN